MKIKLKELERGEYFKWFTIDSDADETNVPFYHFNKIYRKCKYDQSLKKYECRPCVLRYDANRELDRFQKLTSYEKRIYLPDNIFVTKIDK